uniref:Mucin-1 n=1 Tax=Neovison vison TaxID=452646 RepID=A0A8C7EUN9_NEOVI
MTPGFQAPLFLLLLASLQLQGRVRWGASGRKLGPWLSHPFPTRAGSVVVESTLAFRKGATDARSVQTQLEENKKEFAAYHLFISNVRDVSPLSSGQSGSGVPGWGIALLVLVCVLVALAIICVIALTVCQCRRKNCGQLDIFPARDAYHPMSEYPTYHTHGRYMPPGSRRSPYEEVRRGNGGFSSVNPSTSATSANL